jgi:hypothetical protein
MGAASLQPSSRSTRRRAAQGLQLVPDQAQRLLGVLYLADVEQQLHRAEPDGDGLKLSSGVRLGRAPSRADGLGRRVENEHGVILSLRSDATSFVEAVPR